MTTKGTRQKQHAANDPAEQEFEDDFEYDEDDDDLDGDGRSLRNRPLPKRTLHFLGTFPFLAGTWDFLDLTARIDALIPPTEGTAPGNGTLCRALALQLAEKDMSDMVRTWKCFARAEARVLPGVSLPDKSGQLASENYCRLLDQVAAMGCEHFFNTLSSQILERLGWPVQAVYFSNMASRPTSLHGDTPTTISIGGERKRYHQDTKEYVLTALSDRATNLPVFLQGITAMSAHAKKASRSSLIPDALAQSGPSLRKAFPGVRHVVADSALCTAKFIQTARKAGLQVVSRLSAAQLTKYLDTHPVDPAAFVPLADRDGQESLIRAQWCRDVVVGKEHVRALLVEDGELADKKRTMASKKAAQEQKDARVALRRNSRHASRQAAQDFVDQLAAKLQLCRLENVTITRTFEVQAEVVVDQQAVDSLCPQDMSAFRSMVVSTDPDFPWTMEDLWQTSRGPGHTVSPWMLFTSNVWVESAYVASTERYRALVSLLQLFVLLLKITEKLLFGAMEREGIVLKYLNGEPLSPNLQSVLAYIRGQQMAVLREKGKVRLLFHPDLQKILQAMGKPWYAYVDPATYQPRELPEGEV